MFSNQFNQFRWFLLLLPLYCCNWTSKKDTINENVYIKVYERVVSLFDFNHMQLIVFLPNQSYKSTSLYDHLVFSLEKTSCGVCLYHKQNEDVCLSMKFKPNRRPISTSSTWAILSNLKSISLKTPCNAITSWFYFCNCFQICPALLFRFSCGKKKKKEQLQFLHFFCLLFFFFVYFSGFKVFKYEST